MSWPSVVLTLGLVWAGVVWVVGVRLAKAWAFAAMAKANPGKDVTLRGV